MHQAKAYLKFTEKLNLTALKLNRQKIFYIICSVFFLCVDQHERIIVAKNKRTFAIECTGTHEIKKKKKKAIPAW